jgi:hypothetical protein
MKRHIYLFAAAALLWMGGSRPAAAQAQVFSDRATWSSAAGSVVTRDFEELTDLEYVQTVSYDDVSFSSTEGHERDLVAVSPTIFDNLSSRVLVSNRNSNPMVATFSSPVKSVGLDVVTLYGGTGLSATIETVDGSQQVDIPLPGGVPAFIGFISDSGITSVTVSNPQGQNDFACVDNVSYGGNDAPADPASACLDNLEAAIAAGIAGGSIKNIGNSLLGKIAEARAYLAGGDDANAVGVLKAFKKELKAQTGKKIASAKAAELQAGADECIAAIAL